MGRIRTVKPELFTHEELYDAEVETGLPLRFAWIGLFTQCDKEGRFEWRPRRLKAAILPYDEIDFSRVLHAWATRGWVVKYTHEGREFGCIPTWRRHQSPNNRERESEIPPPSKDVKENKDLPTREPRVDDASLTTHMHAPAEREREQDKRGTSVPAAAAPPSVWDYGRQVLGGSLLGKCIRDHGEERTQAAIIATEEKDAADPKSYLLGILKTDPDATHDEWGNPLHWR